MAIKSSVAQIPFFMALLAVTLFIIALLACPVATEESVPEVDMRSSFALDMVNTAYAPFSIKRYLRATTDRTTSDSTYNSEDRAVFSGLTTILESIRIKFQSWWWWVRQRNSRYVFEHFKLNDVTTTKLFEVPGFSQWINFVESKHLNFEDATTSMFTTLETYFSDDVLAKILVHGKVVPGMSFIALRLLHIQRMRWAAAGRSEEQVFEILGLFQTRTQLFESPFFEVWLDYVVLCGNTSEDIFKTLEANFSEKMIEEILDKAIQRNTFKELAKTLRRLQKAKLLRQDSLPSINFSLSEVHPRL